METLPPYSWHDWFTQMYQLIEEQTLCLSETNNPIKFSLLQQLNDESKRLFLAYKNIPSMPSLVSRDGCIPLFTRMHIRAQHEQFRKRFLAIVETFS